MNIGNTISNDIHLVGTTSTTTDSSNATTSYPWKAYAYGNGTHVISLWNGGVMYSTDGLVWKLSTSSVTISTGATLQTGIWTGTRFIFGSSTDSFVMTSTDGINWVAATSAFGTSSVISGLVKLNSGTVVALGYSNSTSAPKIATTTDDGTTWTDRSSGLSGTTWGTTQNVTSAAYNGSLIVAFGDAGGVATSPDGVTWTYRTKLNNDSNMKMYSCTWNGSKFVATGYAGYVFTSPDGITWTIQTGLRVTSWSNSDAKTITWNGTRFIVGGNNGKVAWSLDGVTWTYDSTYYALFAGTATILGSFSFRNMTAVFGNKGIQYTIDNGTTWTNLYPAYVGSVNSITLNDSTMCVYYRNTITMSSKFVQPTCQYTNQRYVIELSNAGRYGVSLWSGVKWKGGVAPTFTFSGTDIIAVETIDKGQTWYATLIGKDMK